MPDSNKIVIRLKEGKTQNYHKALKRAFGGELTPHTYEFKQGRTYIRSVFYTIIPGFEISVSNTTYAHPVEMIREPDNNPDFFHFYLVKEGHFEQNFNNQETLMEAGSSKGVFINNGLFALTGYLPANVTLKMVGFKVTSKALIRLIPEAADVIKTLFEDDEPVAYHTHLPLHLAKMLDDMYHFKKSEFGKIPLVVARGLELFTGLLRSVTELVNKHELNGLHIDDYNRLLKIKDQLLSSFNQKIIVEDIAKENGISASKLKRDFRTLFDTSVYQFYTQAKMDEACHLLQTGKYSVTEVAFDMGYNNLSKFSHMFKKLKGINPKEVLQL